MAGGYGSLVAMYTAISLGGIVWRVNKFVELGIGDGGAEIEKGMRFGDGVGSGDDAGRLLQSLLQSSFTIVLLANLLVNLFVLLALCMKTIFFGTLTLLETQKVVERMINYVLFKGLFLTWVVQPEMMQIGLWLAWFAVLGFLKMFQGLARDRLDRLNASPTATVRSHLRVFSVLILVLLLDMLWIQLCVMVFKETRISTFMLLLFEPLSIAFETLQAVLVHGMQLFETWQRQNPLLVSSDNDRSPAGASWESKAMLVRNFSFGMDLLSLVLALGHCLHIWWLRGLAFQVVDAILFLNLRALLSAILKRIKGFMRVRKAMLTLQGALPDATQEELLSYDDDCAICKEPMGKAKRLPCAHLFHLSCLRSWLDQGLADTYSCPTCRRPLFMGNPRAPPSSARSSHQSSNAQHTGPWRGEADWINGAVAQSSEASPSSGFGRIEFMMRQISGASGGSQVVRQAPVRNADGAASQGTGSSRGFELLMRHFSGSSSRARHQAQASSANSSWSFWPFSGGNSSQTTSSSLSNSGNSPAIEVTPQMMAMVRMVREVLPHVSDDIIVQDLRRTNCATATVNNLL